MPKHILGLVSALALVAAPLQAQDGALQVLRHTPGDTASPGNLITVTFDRPVAGRLEGAIDARRIFRIAPARPGKIEWRDPITVRYVPDEPLAPGSAFVVTIDTAIRALDGSRLPAPYKFSFRVPGPRLLARSFSGGEYTPHAEQLSVDGHVLLLYSAPVDLAALGRVTRVALQTCLSDQPKTVAFRAVRQRPPNDSDPYDFRGAGGWDRDTVGDRFRRVVELEPTAPLPPDCKGQIVLPNTADDMIHGAEERFAIYTVPRFRLLGFECTRLGICSPVDVALAFTSPVKKTDVERYVRFEPPLSFKITEGGDQAEAFRLETRLAPRSKYRVIVDSAIRDIYRRPLEQPRHAELLTGDYLPVVSYPRGILTMPRSGELTLPLRHVNVRQVRLISVPIPDAERSRVLAMAPYLLQQRINRPRSLHADTTLVTLAGEHNVEQFTQLPLPPSVIRARLVVLRVEVARRITGPDRDSQAVARVSSSPFWDPTPYAILQITDLAAHVKLAAGEGAVLITGVRDAKPRSDALVRQIADSGRIVAEGTTGNDGIARLRSPDPGSARGSRKPISSDWPLRVGIIEATLGDDRVILPLSRRSIGYEADNPLDPERLGAHIADAPRAAAALFADRGIYRPGEMLYLAGIVRYGSLGALSLPPAGDSVHLAVVRRPEPWNTSEDVLIRDTVLTLNEFGTVADSFRLRSGLALGSHVAELAVRRGDTWEVVATESFALAEYRAPEFLVALAADSGLHRGADSVRLHASARYLFGAPMARTRIDWSATLRQAKPWEVKIPGADGWTVGVWDWFGAEADGQESPVSLWGSDSLDATGRMTFSIPISGLRPTRPGRVEVQVAVTDLNHQAVTASTEVPIHPTDLYVLARRRGVSSLWTSGQRAEVELRTVRPNGALVRGVPISVSVVRRVWKRTAPNGWVGKWDEELIRADTMRSRDSATVYSIVPGAAGWYELRFAADDGKGVTARTTIVSYVVGPGAAWFAGSPFHLPLVADREEMEIGSEARVAFDSPFDDADAWVSVEREGVIEQRQVAVHRGANVLTFSVSERYVPNVFVGVILLKRGVERPDSAAQVVRAGYVELHVKTGRKRLTVAVVPNDESRPGDTAVVRVRVRDAAGRGVRSAVTVWAVDEGILALTDYSTPDVVARMYTPRSLGVRAWSSLPTILTSDPGLVVALMRRGAMALDELTVSSAAATSVARVSPSAADVVRTHFRSTAFYVASVTTDVNGEAVVRARVPDNLTTYRIMAVAASGNDRFGSGESAMLVTRPLVARPTLPRFVRPGDSLVAGAVVNARDGHARPVTVDAASEGITISGVSRHQITLAEGRGAEARFSFRAASRDNARDSVIVRLHASDGVNADGVETRLPVRPDFSPRTHTAIGLVRDTASVIVFLPSDIDASQSRFTLHLGTSPVAAMLAAYDWLRVYPYDCTEQIASVGRALLSVWRATHGRIPSALGGDPRPRLLELADELSRRQRPDGAIRYWLDYEWSTPWLSTHAGLFLLDARDAGIAVDSTTLAKLAQYLRGALTLPADTGGLNRFDRRARRLRLGNRVAIVDYLRRAGAPNERAEDELLRLAPAMTWEDRLRLAETVASRPDARAAALSLVESAWHAVAPAGRRVDLPDSAQSVREFPSRVAPAARLLTATLRLQPEQPLLGGLVESVLQLGRAEGRWAWSTQDYAAVVLALAALPSGGDSAQQLVVRAGARELLARGAAGADSMASVPLTGLLERTAGGRMQLRLRLTNERARGNTYFAVSVSEIPSKPPVTPDIGGIVVERWYERFDDGRPVTTVQAGDLVRVRLRVTVPADRIFVAVEDPLPAGLEPVDLSLRTSVTLAPFVTPESRSAQAAGDRNRDGPRWQSWLYGSWDDGWWSPWEHKALHDDKVVYFARMLWTGSYTASYVARATTAGIFARPPAHAEEMYNPAVQGRSDGGRFYISEAKP